jgi:GTPase SAR1 family protein
MVLNRSASRDAPLNLATIMNRSSYGRTLKIMKQIDTLSAAAALPHPRIVVIGSESAGKSSMIERIAGASLFPRDAKICTRMPIMLSFVNDESAEQARVTLKFPGRDDQTVREADAAAAVGRLMREVVPPGAGVIDTQLTIEVRKQSVPTLDLIDLPGIVAASIEGEPADMMQRTRAISETYLRDAHTIVVAVVPANITRVRDSQAIQLVQQCGKEAVTLGVLAKADLAHDSRFKQRKQVTPYWELVQRLEGTADDMVALPNGWVAVKNRDTLIEEEQAAGLAQSLQAESDWFENEVRIPDALPCGLGAVLQKIDKLFTEHIRSTWVPAARAHLEGQMALVDADLETLGPAPGELGLDGVLDVVIERILDPLLGFAAQVSAQIAKASSDAMCRAQNAATDLSWPPRYGHDNLFFDTDLTSQAPSTRAGSRLLPWGKSRAWSLS